MSKLLKELNQRPIAYYPIYAQITESIKAGIMLSQIMYWWSAMGETRFYKIDRDFMKELKMTKHEVTKAKNRLQEIELIKITKGAGNKTYYEVDLAKIEREITSFPKSGLPKIRKLDAQKVGIQLPEKREALYTEITTENTHRLHCVDSEKKEPEWTPATLHDYLEKMFTDKREAIRLIADYLTIKGVGVKNATIIVESAEEMRFQIKRMIRPATNLLKGYKYQKIEETMELLKAHAKITWTLETVGKYIHLSKVEIIKQLTR